MNKTLINTIYYSLGELLPKVISFLLLPLYTRYLSPSDYGIVSYTTTITTFLSVIGMLGLNSYVLRYYFIYKDEESRKKVVGTAFIAVSVFNLFILGIAFLVMPSIIDTYDIQVAWNPFFMFALVTNLFTSFSTIPLCLYRIKQEANNYVLINISRTMLTVIFNLLFIVWLNAGIEGYFYAHLYSSIPFIPIFFVIIGKYSKFNFSFSFLKEGLRFALPLVPGTLAYIIINMSDRIILERNVSMSQIGLYNIAITISSALQIVIQSGYHAIEPDIFSNYGSEDYYDFVRRLQKVFYSFIFVAGLLIALFSQEVFALFLSSEYYSGYLFVPILVVTAVISGQNIIYGAILQGDRKSKIIGGITILGSILSFTFNIILIPLIGVWGAAAVGLLSMACMNFMEFSAMKFEGKTIWREIILSVLILVFSYLCLCLFEEVTPLSILIKIVSFSIYTWVLLNIYNINIQDIFSLFIRNRKIQ